MMATTFSLIATTSPGSRATPPARAPSSAAPSAAARSSWLRTSPARSGTRAQVSPCRRMIRCRPGLGWAVATRASAPDRRRRRADRREGEAESAAIRARGAVDRPLEVDAQPELDIDRPPEEERLLAAPDAGNPEGGGDRLGVPVRAGLEGWRAHQRLDRRALLPEPAELRGREADLAAALADLLGQDPAHRLAQDAPRPATRDDRRRGQTEDPFHQLLVEEGQARLHGVGHRVAVLVAEQRGQREGGEVLKQPPLEVVLHPWDRGGGASRVHSGRSRAPTSTR